MPIAGGDVLRTLLNIQHIMQLLPFAFCVMFVNESLQAWV